MGVALTLYAAFRPAIAVCLCATFMSAIVLHYVCHARPSGGVQLPGSALLVSLVTAPARTPLLQLLGCKCDYMLLLPLPLVSLLHVCHITPAALIYVLNPCSADASIRCFLTYYSSSARHVWCMICMIELWAAAWPPPGRCRRQGASGSPARGINCHIWGGSMAALKHLVGRMASACCTPMKRTSCVWSVVQCRGADCSAVLCGQ